MFFEVTASLAQPVERSAVNRKVTGSIPVGSVFRSDTFASLINRIVTVY